MITRIVAVLELVLVLLPTTALALLGVAVAVSGPFRLHRAVFGLSLALALVALTAAWRLLIDVSLGRSDRLRAVSPLWWIAVYVGGGFALAGSGAALVVNSTPVAAGVRDVVASAAVVAFCGLPMLAPLIHLMIERHRGG